MADLSKFHISKRCPAKNPDLELGSILSVLVSCDGCERL